MKKKRLEIFLEGLEKFSHPKAYLEQYSTPANIAAELLVYAKLKGDLSGSVCDLGCGTGIFAIGAKILGADKVYAIDVDENALEIARRNADKYDCGIDFIRMDIADIDKNDLQVDTVLMNPPFKSHKDIKFLNKSLELADVVYSMHNGVTEEFINNYVVDICNDFEIRKIRFPIKRTFEFHRKNVKEIDVNIYRFQR